MGGLKVKISRIESEDAVMVHPMDVVTHGRWRNSGVGHFHTVVPGSQFHTLAGMRLRQGSDPRLALFLQKGENWPMPNCSQATCEGNNVVSLSPRQCPEVKAPSCANGYPPLKVDDQDGCCQHYQCQCEWGQGSQGGTYDRGGENEDSRKGFPLSSQGWGCQVERASGRRGEFSVSQNPSSL